MQVHLIRHTTPAISTDICYGQSEVPLAQSFVIEKNWLLKQLDAQYDAVFSSPLSRCTQLAQQIPSRVYQTDARLLEMNFGHWELQKWNDIAPESLNLWMNDFVNWQVESGESLKLMSQRVVAFIEELSEQAHQNVAIVTHAGVIRIFWAWVLEIPLQNIFRLKIGYGEIYTLTLNRQKDQSSIALSAKHSLFSALTDQIPV
jgi:alpha-ribazole phosphatase